MEAIVFANYTQAELDAQYDNQRSCPGYREILAHGAQLGIAAQSLAGERDVRWGGHPLESLDLYRPAAGDKLPVVVYIHGGAWMALDKEDSAFPAPAFVDSGCLFVALGFPDVADGDFADMVGSVRRGVAWIQDNIARFGGDPARIVLIGHSSGTHLVTQCLTHDWNEGVPFAGALIISGLCDLEPVRLSYRNAKLQLSPQDVLDYSLVHHRPAQVPVAVAIAEHDTGEFRRQSRAMAGYLRETGKLAADIDVVGRNHYDVVLDLCDPRSELHRAAISLTKS